jgi:hypothetical protein
MIPRYAEHPLSQILPMMGEADLKELADDIGENGLRESIVLYEDKILDGRNRYKACGMVKVAPRFTHLNGGRDPLSFIISTNIRRRHLTESQRAMVAAKIADMRRGGDRKTEAKSDSKTLKQAAQELNVSRSSVATAKQVLKEAPPEEVAKVERGEKTVTQVARETKAKKVKPEVQLDKTGYAIPESILFDWNRAAETSKDLLSHVSAVRSELRNAFKEQDIIFAEVTNTTEADLNNAYTSLKCVAPYAVCTSCQGHNRKKCGLCKGRGFISEFAWRSFVPEEMKKMRGAK